LGSVLIRKSGGLGGRSAKDNAGRYVDADTPVNAASRSA
jgi:hypothetical protein